MSTLDKKNNVSKTITHQINGHGTEVRLMTVYAPDRVTEIFMQQCEGKWVPYKRIVHAVN